MNRTDRLLAIVLELQANGARRAEDLARTFEISKRTIYRDIQALGEAGVPLVAVEGGWALDEGYFLPPMAFTVDEATLLLLGVDAVSSSFDAEYRAAALSAGRKIQAALPDTVQARVDTLRDSLIFIDASNRPPDEIEALRQIRRAILRQQTIRFRYFTRFPGDGRVSVRDADPYALVCIDGAWLMLAYCHQRRDRRNFRLTRMQEVSVTPRTFTRPEYSVTDADARIDRRPVRIRLHFNEDAAPWVMEDRYFYIDSRKPDNEGVAVTLRVHTIDEAVQWILGWGRNVRVIEPASLRDRLHEEVRAMLENFSEPL